MIISSSGRERMKRESQMNKSIEAQEKHFRDQRKPYKATKWAREMTNAIQNASRNNLPVPTKVLKELDKRGMLKRRDTSGLDSKKGGFC